MDNKTQSTVDRLEKEFQQCKSAEGLMNLNSGRLLVDWLTARINQHVKEITSDKFEKDHVGYLTVKKALDEDRWLLNKIQLSVNPNVQSKINNQLKQTRQQLKEEQEIDGL